MGKFVYERDLRVDFEDRLLAHLQRVILNKLRRGESLAFTWKDDTSIGDGRTSVWLHPGSSLVFKFYGSKAPELNRFWVDRLTIVANSNTGLHVVPEPGPEESRGLSAA